MVHLRYRGVADDDLIRAKSGHEITFGGITEVSESSGNVIDATVRVRIKEGSSIGSLDWPWKAFEDG